MLGRLESFFSDKDIRLILALMVGIVLSCFLLNLLDSFDASNLDSPVLSIGSKLFGLVFLLVLISGLFKVMFAVLLDVNLHIAVYFLILLLQALVVFKFS